MRRLPPAIAGALAVLALAAPAASEPDATCVPSPAWPVVKQGLGPQVVALVNEHRATIGRPPLRISRPLTLAAEWKARHMAAYHYLTHEDPAPPVERTPRRRLTACGYPPATWGENIAEGQETAEEVVADWLDSPGHRVNIEGPAFRAIGVAAAGEPLSWAQEFGSEVDAPEVRADCAAEGRSRVTCRVRAPSGTPLDADLVRGRTLYARARGQARSGAARLVLRPKRALSPGRYRAEVTAGLRAGDVERRDDVTVR